jgi:hypothetical protein
MATPYIPTNKTTLSLQDFANGSLFPQVDPLSKIYQTPSKPVNLTIFPNDIASLTFSVNENSSLPLELAAVMLDSDRFLVSIRCISPLSGQYDTLSRALFYTLLVISLVFRRHAWISVAALGTAMSLCPFLMMRTSRQFRDKNVRSFGIPCFNEAFLRRDTPHDTRICVTLRANAC